MFLLRQEAFYCIIALLDIYSERRGLVYKKPAKTAPMGWNSWDCFGAAVNERQLLENADYMAKYLKPFGWEYIICDIQWYEPLAKTTIITIFILLILMNTADCCRRKTAFRVPQAERDSSR